MNAHDQANELEERFIDFAVSVIMATNHLPDSAAGRHVSNQLLRSGTAPAPNYGEARGAESDADFVHKLKIVVKELNETSIWLRIARKAELLNGDLAEEMIEENKHLGRIISASVKTVKTRLDGGLCR